MASVAASKLTSAPPVAAKQAFTVIFTTPRCATPTFLHDLQQDPALNPVFIGEDGIFFRKSNLTQWGWSHILLFNGEDAQLPTSWSIRQQWRFTLESEHGFKNSSRGGERKRPDDDMKPEDLLQAVRYWYRNDKNNTRLFVLKFIKSKTSTVAQEDQHIFSSLSSDEIESKFGMEKHLNGKVKNVGKMKHGKEYDADPFDHFSLWSFPSDADYGAYLLEAAEKGGNPEISESIVLTQQFELPDSKINKMGWDYGNPYEPYGEDWFG